MYAHVVYFCHDSLDDEETADKSEVKADISGEGEALAVSKEHITDIPAGGWLISTLDLRYVFDCME